MRFAAVTDLGHKMLAATRTEIDRWAAAEAAAGRYVWVFAKQNSDPRAKGWTELVGRWEPIAPL